jgi:uncharacterized protein (DUF58 family)
VIVPRSRLLFWVAVVVLPFAVLGAMLPGALLPSLILIAGLVALAAFDALLAQGALDGISVKLPEVVRLSKDREGAIQFQVKNERRKNHRLRLGLAFPPEIETAREDVQVNLPAGSEWSRLEWRCKPRKRGNYRLHQTYLEGASPLGFWSMRTAAPVRSEIRVYPNLFTERKDLAALFLHRGTFGLHAQRQVGKGRDFEKLREYVHGDSYDEIHWKATAKRGHPVTKVFQIERTQEVYVIVDASRLSARQAVAGSGSRAVSLTEGSRGQEASGKVERGVAYETVLERFVTAALVLGLAAEQQGDLFGLLTFADKVGTFVRASNGQAHYNACRDALYTLEPQTVTPDFDEVATFIRLRLRRRALLVFLTALDDPVLAENFVRNMDLLCRQHLVLVNMLKPSGASPLFSSPNASTMDDLYQRLGGHIQWQNLRELEKVLQRRGVRFSLLENAKMSAQLVSQYIGVKQRQLL